MGGKENLLKHACFLLRNCVPRGNVIFLRNETSLHVFFPNNTDKKKKRKDVD